MSKPKPALDERTDADLPKRTGPPEPALIGAGVVLALVGGAASYVLTPAPVEGGQLSSSLPSAASAAGAGDERPKKSKSTTPGHAVGAGSASAGGAPLGGFTVHGGRGYYRPEPLVVSVLFDGRPRHLKVSLAIETGPHDGETMAENALRIRDALTTYLRAVDGRIVADPASMERLRAQIRRRIEIVAAPAEIGDVLFLDFILT